MDNYEVNRSKNQSVEIIHQLIFQSESVSSLSNLLASKTYYRELIDVIDENGEEDYSSFNDMEMIYLYVHKEKDINEKKNRKENTKKEYLRDLLLFYKHLVEQAHHIELSLEQFEQYQMFKKLNHRNLRKFQEWLEDAPLGKGNKPYSVATLNRKLVIIKGLLTFLFESKYIDQPIYKKIKTSNVRSEDRPLKDLTSLEVSQILDGFKQHPILHGIISVLATTGIRVNEICTARVCDLAYIGGEYWLTVMGKGDKPREVLIHSNVLKTIQTFRRRRRLGFKIDYGDQSPIFTTASGKAYDYKYLSNYLTRKIQTLDIEFIKVHSKPITPHFFRHAWAIISEENGVSLSQIQAGLGHKDLKTTQIYLKRQELRKNNAAHAWKDSDLLRHIGSLD